jgi:uncharacterized delta-60 repeat protein
MSNGTSTPIAAENRRWSWHAVRLAALSLLLSLPMASASLAVPTDFDPTFASDARGGVNFSTEGATTAIPRAVVIQPDGKIVAAGYCLTTGVTSYFCLARFNTNGSLDTTFDGDGRVATAVNPGTNNLAYAMALQPDGKIIVVGSCRTTFTVPTTYTKRAFCAARYTTTGALDSSFGTGGTVSTDVSGITVVTSGIDLATGVALQPDGKMVVSGSCYIQSLTQSQFCLVRYLSNGTPDPAFGSNGKRVNATGQGTASSIALQSDGKILVSGLCSGSICVDRHFADGSSDTNFGNVTNTGRTLGPTASESNALAIQPDGKIIAVGTCPFAAAPTLNGACGVRFNPGGTVDTTFATNGVFSGNYLAVATGYNSGGRAVALQADGRIVVVGPATESSTNWTFPMAARFENDGTYSGGFFGASGTFRLICLRTGGCVQGVDEYPFAVAIQPDGKIVIAGYCSNGTVGFCVARLEGGPLGNKNCSLDLDGDGRVRAETDILIATRIALGFTGFDVLSGITLSGATRSTWPDLRKFLVSQCGMQVGL